MADGGTTAHHGSSESTGSVALDPAMIELVEKLSVTPEPLTPLTDCQLADIYASKRRSSVPPFPPQLELQHLSSTSSSTASSQGELTTPVTMLFPLPPTTAAGAAGRPPPLNLSHGSSKESQPAASGDMGAFEGSTGSGGLLTLEIGDQFLSPTAHSFDFDRLTPTSTSSPTVPSLDKLTVRQQKSSSSLSALSAKSYPNGLLSPICVDTTAAAQQSEWSASAHSSAGDHTTVGDCTTSSFGHSPTSPLSPLSPPPPLPEKDSKYRSMVMFGRQSFGVHGGKDQEQAITSVLDDLVEEETNESDPETSLATHFPEKRRSIKDVEEIMADDLNDLRDAFLPPETRSRSRTVTSRSATRTKSVGTFKLLGTNKPVPGHGTPSTYTVKSGRKMGRRSSSINGTDEKLLEIWSAPPLLAVVEAETSIVRDENGRAVHFGDLLPKGVAARQGAGSNDSPKVVVIFMRHFWCPLGQDYIVRSISQLDPSTLRSHNTQVVLIAPGSYKLIKKYRKLCQCPYPIYSDSTRHLYKLMGLSDFLGDDKRYHQQRQNTSSQTLKSLRNGFLKLPGDPGSARQLGGEFIFGADNVCEFAHRMTTPSDHLEASAVLRTAGVEMPSPLFRSGSTLSSIGNGIVCIDKERKGSWETSRMSDVGSASDMKRPTKLERESATWDEDTEEYVESLGPMSSTSSSHQHSTSAHGHQHHAPRRSVDSPSPVQEVQMEPNSPTRPVKSPLRASMYQQQLQQLQQLQQQQTQNVQTINNHYNSFAEKRERDKPMSTWSSSSSSETGIVTTPQQQNLPPIHPLDATSSEQKDKEYEELVRKYRAQKWGLAYEMD